mmetsp:Transcript_13107/g.27982  ORF Transcript_13107/g.27982 Transcript_13107/m.27982 type:complete len:214 (-) Transcript_13107:135-776(-)
MPWRSLPHRCSGPPHQNSVRGPVPAGLRPRSPNPSAGSDNRLCRVGRDGLHDEHGAPRCTGQLPVGRLQDQAAGWRWRVCRRFRVAVRTGWGCGVRLPCQRAVQGGDDLQRCATSTGAVAGAPRPRHSMLPSDYHRSRCYYHSAIDGSQRDTSHEYHPPTSGVSTAGPHSGLGPRPGFPCPPRRRCSAEQALCNLAEMMDACSPCKAADAVET